MAPAMLPSKVAQAYRRAYQLAIKQHDYKRALQLKRVYRDTVKTDRYDQGYRVIKQIENQLKGVK